MRNMTIALLLAFTSLLSNTVLSDTLKDIYELAVKNDAQLRAAQAQYKADLETEEQGFSQLLPQINAQYSHTEDSGKGKSKSVFTGENNQPIPLERSGDIDTTQKVYSVSLTQKIFDMNAWFSFKSGKTLSQQAEAEFAASQQDLIVRVAEAYFNVLRAQDNLASSQAEEKAFHRQLEQTQQRFDVGLIAITDVHEARAAYDRTVVKRVDDEGQLGVALEAITVITGQSHQNLKLLKESFPVSEPEPKARSEWVDYALKNNFDLKAAEYASQKMLFSAKAAKAGHYPTLSGDINYSDFDNNGDSFGSLSESENQTTSIGITLTVPIYNGGAVSSARRQAYEQYNAARESQNGIMRNTIQATRSTHLKVITDIASVKAYRQSITSSQSAVDATQAGYEVGTRNVVDVLQAKRGLFASLRDYANARYDYVVDLMKLKKLAGILSPQDIYELDKWLGERAAK